MSVNRHRQIKGLYITRAAPAPGLTRGKNLFEKSFPLSLETLLWSFQSNYCIRIEQHKKRDVFLGKSTQRGSNWPRQWGEKGEIYLSLIRKSSLWPIFTVLLLQVQFQWNKINKFFTSGLDFLWHHLKWALNFLIPTLAFLILKKHRVKLLIVSFFGLNKKAKESPANSLKI